MKAKKRTGFFTTFLLWTNCLFALALLVSYLAPVTDPRKIWLIAFFGLAYPPLLVINLIFILIWLFRKSLYALVSALCIVIGWPVLQNNIGFHEARTYTQKESPEAIRIMTYNVHSFKRYGAKNDISTKHEILDIIKQYQPDVIGFQEYYTRYRGEYDMQDSIRVILNAKEYFEPFSFDRKQDGMGLAVFSKYPIVNQQVIRLTSRKSDNQCIYIDVNKHGQIFRCYIVHLQSIGFGKEDYNSLDSAQRGKADVQYLRRIGSKLKQAFVQRSAQVELLKKDMAQCPYPYVLAGDFNDTPSSYAANRLAKGLTNAFRVKGYGLGRTYNGDFPNYQIDYIMASPAFKVTDYRIIERKLSDHYPVYSDLLLNQAADKASP